MTHSNSTRTRRILVLSALIALLFVGLGGEASAQRRATTRRGGSSGTTQSTASDSRTMSAGSRSDRIAFGGIVGGTYIMYSGPVFDFGGLGFHVGGVLDMPIAPRMGLIGRLAYESKGGTDHFDDGSMSGNITFTLNYLELSSALRYDVSPSVLLEGGVALQLGLGGSVAGTATDGERTASGALDGELRAPTQLALTAGAGYRIAVAPNTEIIPTASFNFFVTSPEASDASAHTFRLGARVMFR